MDLGSAISAPRVRLKDNVLHHEVGIKIDKKSIKDKTIKIKRWGNLNLFFGGVNAVAKTATEGDPRRGGLGLSVNQSFCFYLLQQGTKKVFSVRCFSVVFPGAIEQQ